MAFLLTGDRPHGLRNAVVTVGTFDGVHLGHRRILEELKRHAYEAVGESVVITFDPHPRTVLLPEAGISILTPLPEKCALIAAAGIDHVAVVPFTRAFAALSAAEYVAGFLVRMFRPAAIITGYDHRFGADRAGDIGMLRAAGGGHGFVVHEIPAQLVSDAAISSTRIRSALSNGMVDEAATMLGRPYTYEGTVVRGEQLGRTLGYPTANLEPTHADQLLPAEGVYGVMVSDVCGTKHRGMLSIGTRPTVTALGKRSIEVHLFDFANDLYGELLTLHFIKRLRSEEKFSSLEELKAAMLHDEEAARSILEQNKNET